MKITSTKIDDLNQVLTLEVAAEDYAQARKKKLAELQKNANLPGFRKGHVPASMIEKFYGESVLGDTINNVVAKALQDYIQENNLNIIGEPLPCEEKIEQEWKNGNDFTFKFDMALTPEVSLELTEKDKIPYYNITVSDEDKTKLMEGYKKQQELSAKAAEENGEEAQPAMADEELEKLVNEQLENDYKNAAQFRFEKELKDYCVAKSGIQVPEAFLRRWLIAVNEGKFTAEQIDKDFAGFIEDYKWQLVMAELIKKFEIKLDEADIKEEAKAFARYQYSMYGIMNAPEDMLESMAQNIMQDQNTFQRLVENAQTKKVITAAKELITVKNEKISSEKFRELK